MQGATDDACSIDIDADADDDAGAVMLDDKGAKDDPGNGAFGGCIASGADGGLPASERSKLEPVGTANNDD